MQLHSRLLKVLSHNRYRILVPAALTSVFSIGLCATAQTEPAVPAATETDTVVVAPPSTPSAVFSPSSESVANSGAPSTATSPVVSGNSSEAASKGVVEFGAERSSLSNGFGNWNGFYTRSNWRANDKNALNFEVSRQNRFNESGTFYSLGDTYTFNPDLYASLTIGSSSGGASFLPRFRADAFLNRKLLPKRNLVATVGLGLYNAPEIYQDRNLYLGATYYFPQKWIVEGGVRFNVSNPGNVKARSQFVAVTNGRDHRRFITLRYEYGNEAYQLVGNNAPISDFNSRITSLTLRQWLGRKQGFNVVVERYSNPFYQRVGTSAGYFREF